MPRYYPARPLSNSRRHLDQSARMLNAVPYALANPDKDRSEYHFLVRNDPTGAVFVRKLMWDPAIAEYEYCQSITIPDWDSNTTIDPWWSIPPEIARGLWNHLVGNGLVRVHQDITDAKISNNVSEVE